MSDKEHESLQPDGLDGVQGEDEQRTESYVEYDEGVAQSSTQKSAKSSGSAGGSADGQADTASRLYAMRHSLAHIMATAIQKLWPEVRLGVGPVVENGFYYDIDIPGVTISEEDFPKIEAEMRKVIEANQPFEQFNMPVDKALVWADDAKQPYKVELLNDLKREGTTVAKDLNAAMMGLPAGIVGAAAPKAITEVSFYRNGDFTDLCRGPHAESTGKVGTFKLMRIAGAYWRGKDTNPQMQRLYGVAFETEKELRQHLNMLEEAKKRDHRKIGQELDLFVFSPLVGSGLPLFTPRGTVLRDEFSKLAESLRHASGFERVSIPHITKTDLYKVSGHWDKFGDELFLVQSQETSDQFALKPMNCPHHNQIYASRPRSYRDLPVKYFETTTVYRDEKTGELGGLSRVRSISQDDSHAYCSLEQVSDVVAGLIGDIRSVYFEILGMKLKARLSFRDDTDKYLGDIKLWDKAQDIITEQAKANKLDYFVGEGEAAFYGPKIDFMATDAIGREHQVATVQLDFVQPERFELEYIDEKGEKAQPVMIHCAVLGSIERFLSVYIEHTAGKFPLWCAPEQLRVITVNQTEPIVEFAKKLVADAKEKGLRVTLDNSSESVGKKIREAEVWKVPYTVVIGEKEMQSGEVSPRVRADLALPERKEAAYPVENFIKSVKNEARSRVAHASL